MIEKYRNEIDETSSAILSLNTIANTLGATLAGGLAEKAFGDGSNSILWFAGGMTLGILFFFGDFAKEFNRNLQVRHAGTTCAPSHRGSLFDVSIFQSLQIHHASNGPD